MKDFNEEYMRLRPIIRDVRERVRVANINTKFDEMVRMGVVELTVEPDIVPYPFPELDCDDMTTAEKERKRREIEELLEDEGLWMIVGKFRCSHCGSWHVSTMVGGFIGDEFVDTEDEVEVKMQAMVDFGVDALTSIKN